MALKRNRTHKRKGENKETREKILHTIIQEWALYVKYIMPNTTLPTANDTLYYDGQCPLCSKEILWLQRIQNGKLYFKDIHISKNDTLPSSKKAMLKTLHLITENNEWLLGLDATARAWSHTPYGFIVKPLRWPLIRILADKIYRQWASSRYKKKYHCDICNTK